MRSGAGLAWRSEQGGSSPSPGADAVARPSRVAPVRTLGLLALVAALVVGCGASQQQRVEPREERGDPWREGNASWYGAKFNGRKTASGERFSSQRLTAAHRSLRFGTCVLVENLDNGKRVKVRINDRGPFTRGRIIDLSEAAARRLDFVSEGVARVRLSPCDGAPRV